MPTLSVIIPVYNEKSTILNVLNRVNDVSLVAGLGKEIIIVDDASTDGTGEVLKNLGSNFKVFFQEKNGGKGSAVITGLKKSTGDYVVVQDADLEYDPQDYNKLLPPLLSGEADVVYGTRFQGRQFRGGYYRRHYLANRFLTILSNFFTGLKLTDMETCYKMFTRQAADAVKDKLKSKRFGIEPEITARFKRFRVQEAPISYQGRSYAEGKKIGWKDGLSAIWSIIKYNL